MGFIKQTEALAGEGPKTNFRTKHPSRLFSPKPKRACAKTPSLRKTTQEEPLSPLDLYWSEARPTSGRLAVEKKHAIVNANRAMMPLSWSKWTYSPNTERSWKYRAQNDLRNALNPGDVVDVEVVELNTDDVANLRGYAPAEAEDYAAVALRQDPELEGALLSFDSTERYAPWSENDIYTSEFNRATQSGVGSTFAGGLPAHRRTRTHDRIHGSRCATDLQHGNGESEARNYGEEYKGPISLHVHSPCLATSAQSAFDQNLDVVWETLSGLALNPWWRKTKSCDGPGSLPRQ